MLDTQERGRVYTSCFDYVSIFAIEVKTAFGSTDLKNGNVDMVFMPMNAIGQHWTMVVADRGLAASVSMIRCIGHHI